MTAARLIIGCGYLGLRVAARFRDRGDRVYATTRSGPRADFLATQGFTPIILDISRDIGSLALPRVEGVIFAVGYDRTAEATMREVYVAGLARVLDALPPDTERFLYASSTGVYGQDDGGWIDEAAPAQPIREGGRICLEAERLLEGHPLGRRAVTLRLAGLYGPGRVPREAELRAGRPIAARMDSWLNLIQIDDAAAVVLAADAKAPPGRLYLVSDGHPVRRGDYYAEAARLLGVPPPSFVPPRGNARTLSRSGSSKRICNLRMREELGVVLQYPTYREGLAAALAPPRAAGRPDAH